MIESNVNLLDKAASKLDAEHYGSVYRYSEEQFKTYETTKSAAGMNGMKSNQLIFDFDSEDDIDLARNDTKEMYTRLLNQNLKEDDIQIYFSGNKGFHLVIELTDFLTKNEIKNIINGVSDGLDTLDMQVYDMARLFRSPLSLNKKSGLYKIPLLKEELFDDPVATIKQKAAPGFDLTFCKELIQSWKKQNVILPKQLLEFKRVEKEELKEFKTSILLADKPNFENKPRHITDAKYALQEGFFDPGERNAAYTILAALYKHLGYSKEIAYNMIKATDRIHVKRYEAKGVAREPRTKTEIWLQNINPVYSDSWMGGTFSEDQNDLLIRTKKRFNIKEDKQVTVGIDNVADIMINFAENAEQNKILLGIPSIDKEVMITTGMLVSLLGSASSGKTTLAFNIMRTLSMNNQTVLFDSLDMYAPFVFSRLLQRNVKMSFQSIIDEVKKNKLKGELAESWEKVKEEYGNIKFNFKSGPTIEDLENQIKRIQDETSQSPRLIVIDYLEKLSGPYSDATANSGYIAGKLSDLARDYGCGILLLVQPQKQAGDPSEPLLSYRQIKGSSRLEQDSRVVLTTWRPGFNPDNNDLDKYASIAVVKNNMGPVLRRDFIFDGAKGLYLEMGDEQLKQFDTDMYVINERRRNKAQSKEKGYHDSTGV